MTNDPWWEDPGCYLDDKELGITPQQILNLHPQPAELKKRKVRFAS
jgi:hypothetical protein